MILTNLLIGLPSTLLCLIIQLTVTFWSVRYYVRHSGKAGRGDGMRVHLAPLLVAVLIMMLGNFIQIALWGTLFFWLGEFSEYDEAVYHSAVNFTSLGYGDVIMSRQWKLLGPIEALGGILMLGLTGAALMAILQQMIKALHARHARPG